MASALETHHRTWYALSPDLLPADEVETATSYLIRVPVPGYRLEELAVEVVDEVARVIAAPPDTDRVPFEREFRFGHPIDTERTFATLRTDVLELWVPKQPPARPRRVAIDRAAASTSQ